MGRPTVEEYAPDLFENLQSICSTRPALPGDSGDISEEEGAYEGHEQFDRLMAVGFQLELEWGEWSAHRLA